MLILEPDLVEQLRSDRAAIGVDLFDEVWNGVYIIFPHRNIEHQILVGKISFVLSQVLDLTGNGFVVQGLNVSDQVEGWKENYRIPDVLAYLDCNPAINCETHMCGGPDFAVEILTAGDRSREKLEFYARVNTRELLLLDRKPWAIELYRLIDGGLQLVGKSTVGNGEILTSEVLPLTLRLIPGEPWPTIELTRLDGGQVWRI